MFCPKTALRNLSSVPSVGKHLLIHYAQFVSLPPPAPPSLVYHRHHFVRLYIYYRYWIADEIEASGCRPLLTNPAKAKLLMGHVNKTDKLDANGLATLLRLDALT